MRVTEKILIGLIMISMCCVDKVDLSVTPTALPLIIDGQITDANGPYKVSISRAFPVDGKYHDTLHITKAVVTIVDDNGIPYLLNENRPGRYITSGFQGVVGRTYRLLVTTSEGLSFESTPETMLPSGTVDSVYFEYVKRTSKDKGIEEEGFNVYINSTLAPESQRNMRWKFDGTYKVTTNPSAIVITDPDTGEQSTIACAEGCFCCTCWVSERETAPIVINNTFLGSNNLTRVFMGYIPINIRTFNEKYRVEISQMELSPRVYDFYAGVKAQAENASSLFQPPYFELKGNVFGINNDEPVIGIFSATALSKKAIYIRRSDIPHGFFYTEIVGDCRAVAPNSSLNQPPSWQ